MDLPRLRGIPVAALVSYVLLVIHMVSPGQFHSMIRQGVPRDSSNDIKRLRSPYRPCKVRSKYSRFPPPFKLRGGKGKGEWEYRTPYEMGLSTEDMPENGPEVVIRNTSALTDNIASGLGELKEGEVEEQFDLNFTGKAPLMGLGGRGPNDTAVLLRVIDVMDSNGDAPIEDYLKAMRTSIRCGEMECVWFIWRHMFKKGVDPPREGYHLMIESLEKRGNYGEAKVVLNRMLERYPEDRGANFTELQLDIPSAKKALMTHLEAYAKRNRPKSSPSNVSACHPKYTAGMDLEEPIVNNVLHTAPYQNNLPNEKFVFQVRLAHACRVFPEISEVSFEDLIHAVVTQTNDSATKQASIASAINELILIYRMLTYNGTAKIRTELALMKTAMEFNTTIECGIKSRPEHIQRPPRALRIDPYEGKNDGWFSYLAGVLNPKDSSHHTSTEVLARAFGIRSNITFISQFTHIRCRLSTMGKVRIEIDTCDDAFWLGEWSHTLTKSREFLNPHIDNFARGFVNLEPWIVVRNVSEDKPSVLSTWGSGPKLHVPLPDLLSRLELEDDSDNDRVINRTQPRLLSSMSSSEIEERTKKWPTPPSNTEDLPDAYPALKPKPPVQNQPQSDLNQNIPSLTSASPRPNVTSGWVTEPGFSELGIRSGDQYMVRMVGSETRVEEVHLERHDKNEWVETEGFIDVEKEMYRGRRIYLVSFFESSFRNFSPAEEDIGEFVTFPASVGFPLTSLHSFVIAEQDGICTVLESGLERLIAAMRGTVGDDETSSTERAYLSRYGPGNTFPRTEMSKIVQSHPAYLRLLHVRNEEASSVRANQRDPSEAGLVVVWEYYV
ncbi:hypothetical protein AAMO2058_000467200 [Amorphochlora amoebiformis]